MPRALIWSNAARRRMLSVMIESNSTALVSQSEVLSALSHALDLTEGQPIGHTLRACVIGMRLAESLGLGEGEREALYYALLLKDAGCSSNAARMSSLFGTDDQPVKYGMKLIDWHRKLPLAWATLRMTGLRHFMQIAREGDVTRRLIEVRCDRGAEIVRQLGFPEDAARAVRCLDEHWCGLGYPDGLRGDEIPMLARIANIAQTVEIFHRSDGITAAIEVARERSGTWFDPRLVAIVASWAGDDEWWETLGAGDLEDRVVDAEPGDHRRNVDGEGLDRIARAFADIIDAKSPYTYRHSSNVADYALGVAAVMGLGDVTGRIIYRAGLLHDIGKLGISNQILDKPGRLTDGERKTIELHPLYSWEILSRVTAFSEFARMASLHHEKLDGSGYPWGVPGDELDASARVLCVVDIYEALTADRPYRAGMTPDAALAIIEGDTPTRLCADTVEGLRTYLAG
jgi:putative nucleotidyltransferase with HDIG domain